MDELYVHGRFDSPARFPSAAFAIPECGPSTLRAMISAKSEEPGRESLEAPLKVRNCIRGFRVFFRERNDVQQILTPLARAPARLFRCCELQHQEVGRRGDAQGESAGINGTSPRNCVLYGPAGHAYVYAIYGRYFCMNVSCEIEGQAGCVLLRALAPVMGADQMALNRGIAPGAAARQLTSGPSRLCQALGLTRTGHNGLNLLNAASPLQLRDDGYAVNEMLVTARIGIHEAVDWPLRFALAGHNCVSGPRNLTGKRILLR